MNSISETLKILVLTTSFPIVKGSRSGIFVKQLVENLPTELQVSVLTPDGTHYCTAQSDKYSLVCFRYAPKKWQQLAHGSGGIVVALSQNKLSCCLIPVFLFSSLATCCWYALKADVIHANWSINGVVAGISGFLVRRPVVTTLRGSDVNLIHSSWLMRQLVHLCLCLSKRVIVVSTSLKKSILREFPNYRHKVQIIFNGIDDAFYSHNKKVSDSLKIVRFLYVGNLVKGKGVHCILEAVKSLSTQSWSLDIVGDGSEKRNLVAYCKCNGIDSKVTFHGAVAPEKVPLFLQKADIFVFASLAEGRPNVVLEAMAMGLPVIASAIPAVQELIIDGKQGILFPPGNVGKLQESIEDLLAGKGKRQIMGKMARECILSQKLSWLESGRQYAAVFNDVYLNKTEIV